MADPELAGFMERWSAAATAAEAEGRDDEWFAGVVEGLLGAGPAPEQAGHDTDEA